MDSCSPRRYRGNGPTASGLPLCASSPSPGHLYSVPRRRKCGHWVNGTALAVETGFAAQRDFLESRVLHLPALGPLLTLCGMAAIVQSLYP